MNETLPSGEMDKSFIANKSYRSAHMTVVDDVIENSLEYIPDNSRQSEKIMFNVD